MLKEQYFTLDLSNIYKNFENWKLELALAIFLNIKKGWFKLQEFIWENLFKNLRVNFEKVMNLVSIVLVIIIVLLFLNTIVLGSVYVVASNDNWKISFLRVDGANRYF